MNFKEEFKKQMVRKLLLPCGKSARELALEIGEWLRKRGLKSEDLQLWEKELLKKNNALAELSAIVILKKKWRTCLQRKRKIDRHNCEGTDHCRYRRSS